MSATTASAAGYYISGNAGLALPNTLTTNYDDRWEILSADTEFDTGWVFAGAFGYDFGDGLRTEFELGYQQSNSKETEWSLHGRDQTMTFATTALLEYDLTATTYLINGYYDFKNNSPFTPFLGAGLGMATVEFNDFFLGTRYLSVIGDFSDTVFAYQLSAGVSYAFSKNFAMDLTYRYLGADDPKYDAGHVGRAESEFGSNNFMLGGRLAF
jgi:opacity protein-like surface antigen